MIFRDTKYNILENGSVVNIKTGKTLSPVIKPTGYAEVRLSDNGKTRSYSHHRVVYESFNGPIPVGMQVNHINGIKTDNKISNLELVTPSENQVRRVNLRRGEAVNTAKLKIKDIIDIKASNTTTTELVSKYNISRSTVNKIRSGRSWKHVA